MGKMLFFWLRISDSGESTHSFWTATTGPVSQSMCFPDPFGRSYWKLSNYRIRQINRFVWFELGKFYFTQRQRWINHCFWRTITQWSFCFYFCLWIIGLSARIANMTRSVKWFLSVSCLVARVREMDALDRSVVIVNFLRCFLFVLVVYWFAFTVVRIMDK